MFYFIYEEKLHRQDQGEQPYFILYVRSFFFLIHFPYNAQKSFHAYLMSVVIVQRRLRCGEVIYRVTVFRVTVKP
jgi:hypothetical protein